MLIYFDMIFLNMILGILDRSYFKKVSLMLMMITLFLIVGLRAYSVGTDTLQYVNGYSLIRNQSISSFTALINSNFFGNQRLEPGYVYLVKILNLISPNPQLIILVESFLVYFSSYLLIKNFSLNHSLSVYFLITLDTFITSFNLLRQCIALSFCIIGYCFFTQNKIKKYFISVLIAGLFHRTALIFLILILFRKCKIDFNKKILIRFLIVTFLIVVFYEPFIQLVFKLFPYYKSYQGATFGSGKLSALFNLLFGVGTLIFGLYSKKHGTLNSVFSYKRWNELSLIILMSLFFTALSLRFTQIDRISLYFRTFYMIYIPNCIYINKNQNQRILFTFAFSIVSFALFSYMLIYKDNWNQIVPYYTFFSQNKI